MRSAAKFQLFATVPSNSPESSQLMKTELMARWQLFFILLARVVAFDDATWHQVELIEKREKIWQLFDDDPVKTQHLASD